MKYILYLLIFLLLISGCSKEEFSEISTIIDNRDETEYEIVKIGSQWWFAENLDFITGDSRTQYGKHGSNNTTYGGYYKFENAITACPSGWHLPSDDEWTELELFLGMDESEVTSMNRGYDVGLADKLKSNSELWDNYLPWWGQKEREGSGSNESGFSALPGGLIYLYRGKYFSDYVGKKALFWTSTISPQDGYCYTRQIINNSPSTLKNFVEESNFISVRCIKDD